MTTITESSTQKTQKDYPYKEFTYKINGLIYETFKELGFGYQEKYYHRTFEKILQEHQIKYKEELCIPIKVNGEIIGRYFVDFVLEDKVVVEFKIANEVYQRHFKQVYGYLKAKNFKVGLLALITPKGIKIKRIIN